MPNQREIADTGWLRIPHSAIRIPRLVDPGKLAAWLSAKHVEKDPKKKAPTP
jgi:hypothetical protein